MIFVQVSDFGLCRKLDHADQVLTIAGGKLPLKWMALESLQTQKFSIKTDMYVQITVSICSFRYFLLP